MRKFIAFGLISLALFGALYPSYASGGLVYALVNSDLDRFVEYVTSFGPWAAVVFVLTVTLECVVAPIPPLVLYIAGGLLYGGFWGGTLTLAGNVLGAGIAFSLARYFARDWVRAKVDPKTRQVFDRFVEKYGMWSLVLLRINPTTSTDLFSYLAGMSDMKASRAILGTVLGLAPLVYLQTYIGADLVSRIPFFGFVFLWLSVAYFVIFAGGIFVAWRRLRARSDTPVDIGGVAEAGAAPEAGGPVE